MFITLEGLDFCGKTTQARMLVARLQAELLPGEAILRPVRFIREPGGTPIAERIREILLNRKNLELSDLSELLLFSASRAQLVVEVIRPALLRGETVICDRFHDSTTAYQGYGRGLDLDVIRRINSIATEGLDPDLTLLIDVTVEEMKQRKLAAGLAFDRMESAGGEFYERVRTGYFELARHCAARFVRIDGMAAVERVHADVWDAVVRHARRISQSH